MPSALWWGKFTHVRESAASPDAFWRVDVPAEIWRNSDRPRFGQVIRIYVAVLCTVTALVMLQPGPYYWGLIAAGIAIFVLTPNYVNRRLTGLAEDIQQLDAQAANDMLRELPRRRLIRYFAPFAWLPLQQAKLHLRRGDGRAATLALAETARLSKTDTPHQLRSAEAMAALMGGDRKRALNLLRHLEKHDQLGPRDQLHLGLCLLLERKKPSQALAHLQAAQEALGGHTRVLAGLVLAYQRSGEPEQAATLLESIDREALAADPLARDLVKRAEKGLRSYLRAREKRAKRSLREQPAKQAESTSPEAKPSQQPAVVDEPSTPQPVSPAPSTGATDQPKKDSKDQAKAKPKKSQVKSKPRGKRARKQARREARRKAKAEQRAQRRREQAEQAAATAHKHKPAARSTQPAPTEVVAKPAAPPHAEPTASAPAVAQPKQDVGTPKPSATQAKPAAKSAQPAPAKVVAKPAVPPHAKPTASAPAVAQPKQDTPKPSATQAKPAAKARPLFTRSHAKVSAETGTKSIIKPAASHTQAAPIPRVAKPTAPLGSSAVGNQRTTQTKKAAPPSGTSLFGTRPPRTGVPTRLPKKPPEASAQRPRKAAPKLRSPFVQPPKVSAVKPPQISVPASKPVAPPVIPPPVIPGTAPVAPLPPRASAAPIVAPPSIAASITATKTDKHKAVSANPLDSLFSDDDWNDVLDAVDDLEAGI